MEKRIIGAIFLVLSAVLGFILAGEFLVGAGAVDDVDVAGFMSGALTTCGILVLVFSILTILGAFSAFTGKSWGLALIGGIFGLLTIGPWPYAMGLGSLFGLIGLIIIAISGSEFKSETPPPMQPYPPQAYPPAGYPPQQPPPGYPPQQPPPGQYPPQQPPMGQPPAQPPMEQPPAAPPAEPPMEEVPAEPEKPPETE